MLNWYRFKQPVTQAQEANTLCYASFLRQIYYFYRPDILGLKGGQIYYFYSPDILGLLGVRRLGSE